MLPSRGSLLFFSLIVGGIAALLLGADSPQPLLPPLVALAFLALTRSAGWSLFLGSLVGVFIIGKGSLLAAPWSWLVDHLWPSLASPWHWSALLFTLLLAAFAAIMERSGALGHLLKNWSQRGKSSPASRLQLSIVALGLLCFFDGLANALMLGRVGRTLADQAKVSREKLAYLVDTTSSAVACVAFLSTWSVFQLTLISNELADSVFEAPSYLLFLKSIPTNFYCLTSLLLVILSAHWNWNPPPMGKTVPLPTSEIETGDEDSTLFTLRSALGPLAVLLLSVPLAFWIFGGQKLFPTSLSDVQEAFNTSLGPYALLLAGVISIGGAVLFFPREKAKAWRAVPSGVFSVAPALVVLMMAWTLGSTLTELETGQYLAGLIGDEFQINYLPLATFLLGCLVAFSTGTSWGTMALLMPLALGTFLSIVSEQGISPEEVSYLLPPIIAAVFGGAVFGDHASPFSDTTIVSALACDVSTTTHVATQLPYALLAAGSSVLFGYLPIAWGWPLPLAMLLPLGGLTATVVLTRKRFSTA